MKNEAYRGDLGHLTLNSVALVSTLVISGTETLVWVEVPEVLLVILIWAWFKDWNEKYLFEDWNEKYH